MRYSFVGLLLLVFNTTVLAQTTVPFTFTSGKAAKASEVNANFAALVTAVNALEAKIGPHTMASLAGTYDYFAVKIDVDNVSASTNNIAGAAESGTVVLNANGSGQANTTENYRRLAINTTPLVSGANATTVTSNNTSLGSNNAITWSFASGVVTISVSGGGGGNFVVVGQLLIQSMMNFEARTQGVRSIVVALRHFGPTTKVRSRKRSAAAI